MSSVVFYCNNCGKSFASEDYGSGERPRCPRCDQRMISTGYAKDDWLPAGHFSAGQRPKNRKLKESPA